MKKQHIDKEYNNHLTILYNEVLNEFKMKNINLKHEIELYFPKKTQEWFMSANATKWYYRIDIFSTFIKNYNLTVKEIKDIFKHEITHIIEFDKLGKMSGHGKQFKNLCFELWNDRNIGNATI